MDQMKSITQFHWSTKREESSRANKGKNMAHYGPVLLGKVNNVEAH